MAEKKRVVVAGAGGVFGSLLVDELRDRYDVVPTTRQTLDLRDLDAVRNAAKGAFAFACTAGPFQQLDRYIVRAVVDAGAHWLDIADYAPWFFGLLDDRDLDALARERNVAVMPGLSTLPAVSSALVRRLGTPQEVDITLFVGNANRKGAAAMISAAQLQSPDPELLRREFGITARVHTRFELPGVHLLLRSIKRLRLAKLVSKLPIRFGTRGGYVEVRAGDRVARAEARDQRIAILPLVFALERVHDYPGCHPPTVLDPEELLDFVSSRAKSRDPRRMEIPRLRSG